MALHEIIGKLIISTYMDEVRVDQRRTAWGLGYAMG
jgi:hypothetical protein